MSLLPIPGYSPNRQDYIDDPDKFNNPMLGGSMLRSDDVYNRGQAPTEMPMPPAPRLPQVYELPSDAKDLQRLREEYDRLSNIRFVQDPGPEFGAKLQALAGQISQLDPEFKNPYAIGGDLGAGPRRPDEGLDLDELLNRQLNIRQMPPGRGTVFRGTPDEGYRYYGVGEGVPGTSDGLPLPPQMPDTQQQAGGASFESDYIDWMESKPNQPKQPRGMGGASKKNKQGKQEYKENLKKGKTRKRT